MAKNKKNTLDILLYNVERELHHLSRSAVKFWSGLITL